MKVLVIFKTPEAVDDAVQEAAGYQCADPAEAANEVEAEERQHALADFRDAARKVIGKFVKYGEYVTVEFDTEAGTATVIPVR